ncbi:hypothetical protein Tco_0184222 [Tanacetum coccineum]
MKNNSVGKENRSNVFRKEREQYHEIQDLKAQMQDKNIAISELKKLIENCKGKSVETQFNKPSVVRQPNAQRIPKLSVLGKLTPFSNSHEMRSFKRTVSLKCKSDECDHLEYLSRLNPRASAQNKDAKSHKTTKRYMPVEKSSASKKPERQIPTGHRFSNKKTTTVPEKTMNPRSCLRWKPTGRIFSNVHLRWIPIGKLLNSCTGKVDSEPAHGSIVDIPHIHACKQTLGLSAGTSFNGQKQQRIDLNADALYNEKQENLRVWLLKLLISKKPVPECRSSTSVFMAMMSDHNSSDLAPQRQEMSVENVSSGLVPQGHKASDYDNFDPVPPRHNVVPTTEKTDSSQQGKRVLISKNQLHQLLAWKLFGFSLPTQHTSPYPQSSDGRENGISFKGPLKEECLTLLSRKGFVDPIQPKNVYLLRKALYGLKQAPRARSLVINLLSWMSKKQNCTAMTFSKRQSMWRYLQVCSSTVDETQLKIMASTTTNTVVLVDSQSAIAITGQPLTTLHEQSTSILTLPEYKFKVSCLEGLVMRF